MDHVLEAAPQPSLPVVGTSARFPVHRIYCVGRNYLAHVREFGNDEKALPFFFSKTNDMIVESGSTIPYPPLTQNFHHEVELVVAIGKGGANIPAESALDHVYGYAVGFDMTRRDLQQAAAKSGRPWEVGKSFDHAAPCGAIYPVASVGHVTEGGQVLRAHRRVHRQEPAVGRDHQGAGLPRWRPAEPCRIGELPPEVESAQEAERFTQGDTVALDLPGQGELRLGVDQIARALPAAMRRREEKDLRGAHGARCHARGRVTVGQVTGPGLRYCIFGICSVSWIPANRSPA